MFSSAMVRKRSGRFLAVEEVVLPIAPDGRVVMRQPHGACVETAAVPKMQNAPHR